MWHIGEVSNCGFTFLQDVEHVEDNSKSGRPSAGRTEANIEHVMCGDHRLTVRLIASELNMNRNKRLEDYHQRFGHGWQSCWIMIRRQGAHAGGSGYPSSILKPNQTFLGELSLVMSCGSSSTSRRQNARAFSGRVQSRQGWRKSKSKVKLNFDLSPVCWKPSAPGVIFHIISLFDRLVPLKNPGVLHWLISIQLL